MLKMQFRRDILFWYDIYELQATEEEVISERRYDKKGKEIKLPSPSVIREIVNEKIQERRNRLNGREE